MTPLEVVLKLKTAKSASEKSKVLMEAWNDECYDFFEGIHLALDPLIQFDLPTVPRIIEDDNAPDELGFMKFRQLALQIYYGEIKATKKVIEDALNTSSVNAWNEWYRRILLKDFSGIVTTAQINKLLSSLNETSLMIPTLRHQKCSSYVPYSLLGVECLVDGFISGDRLLTILRKIPQNVFFINHKSKIVKYEDLQIIEDLIEYLPGDIVLDGVYSEGRYYVFDILPLDEYRVGDVGRTQSDRHAALCELQDLFTDLFQSKIRILPKKRIMITRTLDIEDVKKEFMLQGYKDIVIKKVNAFYQPGRSTSNWCRNKQ